MENNVQGKNTKRKHLNKNKKKSWRKVNVDDVEDFLEDQRLQERTGGLVAEKSDDALFFVDTNIKDKKGKQKGEQGTLIRKRKAQEQLKDIEETLKPPPPKKKDKRAKAVIEREATGHLTTKLKDSFAARKSAKQQRVQKLKEKHRVPVADYDLWGDTLDKDVQQNDEHFLRVTRKLRTKPRKDFLKPPSLIPAVEAPHPGASYNPALDDYQNLLKKAHDKEAKQVLEEERIRRALDEQFPGEAITEEYKLVEMSAGLYDEEDSNESENEAGDLDKLSVNPPVRRENKKDERKRKKEKALREKSKEMKKLKQKRVKDNNFYRLKSIKAEVREREAELAARAEKRKELRAQEPYKTKRIARQKYEEPDEEIKLSEDLVGSLRELKPEGHLLLDRFHSMMKRNILEPRGAPGKRQKRKYKPKVFEKKSHKEIT